MFLFALSYKCSETQNVNTLQIKQVLCPGFLKHTTDISDHITLHLREGSCAMDGVSQKPWPLPSGTPAPQHHLPGMKMSPNVPRCSLGVGSPGKYCGRHIYTKNILHSLSEIKCRWVSYVCICQIWQSSWETTAPASPPSPTLFENHCSNPQGAMEKEYRDGRWGKLWSDLPFEQNRIKCLHSAHSQNCCHRIRIVQMMHWDLIQCVARFLSKQLKTGAQILPFTS